MKTLKIGIAGYEDVKAQIMAIAPRRAQGVVSTAGEFRQDPVRPFGAGQRTANRT